MALPRAGDAVAVLSGSVMEGTFDVWRFGRREVMVARVCGKGTARKWYIYR
jgi:hypothetical protein